MGSFQDYPDALWFEHRVDSVGNLCGHAFLDLQPFGVGFNDASQFRYADDAPVRHIGNPGMTDERRHVMLAMALKRDVPEDDHFVVAFDFFERLLENPFWILVVAGEMFLKGPHYAPRRFTQAIAIRVFADPGENGAKRDCHIRFRDGQLAVVALPDLAYWW